MDTNVTQLQGGKEIGLFELKKHSQKLGYSVPEFFVLTDIDNEEELQKIATHFDNNVIIVRSNSVMENNDFGFDGIYESFLLKNWDIETLKRACKDVFDSLFSPNAIAYRNKICLTEDSMRVIVQRFIGDEECSADEELQYFVMETSINAQGDIYIVMDEEHDFVNHKNDYQEIVIDKGGNILTIADKVDFLGKSTLMGKIGTIATGLQKVFGPVSIEGACIKSNSFRGDEKVFLFQRRLLPKELYQAQPEIVPAKYTDKDIIFRSNSYRGAGKMENLPIIVMSNINYTDVESWENDLRGKITQLKSDVILFVQTMALGALSSRILNDYTALSGVKAIVSCEKIDFSSHAFKVASLARIPFVSVGSFSRIKTLSMGSLFFTENQAVFCLDKKRKEFDFNHLQKSKAVSLAKIAKNKGVIIKYSNEEHTLEFQLNLKNISFKDFGTSFHRLLEDVSNEVWLFEDNGISIGFRCENSKGQIISFSGWAYNGRGEGHVILDNFTEGFKPYVKNTQIEWDLIKEILLDLLE